MAYEGKYARRRDKQIKNDDAQERRTPLGRFLDNHIRLVVAVATVCVLLVGVTVADLLLNGSPFYIPNEDYEGEEMKMGYLMALDEKSGGILWNDFKGLSYETVSESEYDSGIYVMRRYSIEGGKFTVTAAGFTDGEAYTGYVEYATVSYTEDFDFSYSLIEDENLSAYMEKYGIRID